MGLPERRPFTVADGASLSTQDGKIELGPVGRLVYVSAEMASGSSPVQVIVSFGTSTAIGLTLIQGFVRGRSPFGSNGGRSWSDGDGLSLGDATAALFARVVNNTGAEQTVVIEWLVEA